MKNKAAIASGHAQSCQVASEILQFGGNVVDAAIATLSAMFITEPAMSSPGGGGFATVKMNGRTPLFFDFFCHTPLAKKSESDLDIRSILVNFGDDQELFYTGNGTIAVPGMIAGLYALHDEYGSIPIEELFQPAVKLLKEGVFLDAFQAYDLGLLSEIFLSSAFGENIFGKNGKLKGEGEQIKMPELADFMDTLAIEGQDLFYRGEAGQECAQIHRDHGGMMTMADFASYRVEVRNPLVVNQKNACIYTTPLPFLGGSILNACMQYFDNYYTRDKVIYQSLYEAFREVASIEKDPQKLKDILEGGPLLPSSKNNGSTSHFSIVDNVGNAISITTSIGEGSGLFLPTSGIHLNNMLGELALLPGDLNSWMPNVRLNSRMCPSIMETDRKAVIAMGTGGAGRIPYVLAQCIQHWLNSEAHPGWNEILEYPRVYVDNANLHMEKPLGEGQFSDVDRNIKVWNEPSMFFGGVNLASLEEGALQAAADRRRIGHTLYT